MDLSEEMQEALRILKEDGQIGAYNRMTESNKALVERLDQIETRNSERDAQWEERFKNAGKSQEGPENSGGTPGSGDGGGAPGGDPGAGGAPAGGEPGGVPPVKKEETPPPGEGRPRRKAWYESEVYTRGD